MKRILVACAAVGLSALAAFGAGVGRASPPDPQGGRSQASGSASAALPEGVVLSLAPLLDASFRWGMQHTQVQDIYVRAGGVFDQEYAPLLAKMQPGTRMEALVSDRESRKRGVRASFVEFKEQVGFGFDNSAVGVEYTYRNHESMQWVERAGVRRYFFFFGAPPDTRLWKLYDEVALKEDGAMGASFEDAVKKVTQMLGGKGRERLGENGQRVVEWQDGVTLLRMVDRPADHVAGFVFAERSTLARLDQLRPNKPENTTAIDPFVARAMAGSQRPAPPAPSASASASAKP